ncbi:MAG: polyphosphate polymerase domain-containing protein [Clostridiales bacterium]|nr:polyphosphate polymerase domain-containing protein [Clostridiales bacterium]
MERYELKKFITYEQYLILRTRVKALMRVDPYSMPSGDYVVSNIYFDDIYNSAYNEKLDGVKKRDKYRIRSYNGDDSYIVLECKAKQGDRIYKRQERIAAETLNRLYEGDITCFDEYDNELCREVSVKMRSCGLTPKVSVIYRREAYIYPICETRVTFDMDLHASNDLRMFGGVAGVPVFSQQRGIMEIKYNDFIPKHIVSAITSSAPRMALSKYCLCRERLHGRIE